MFGRVLNINDTFVQIENLKKTIEANVIGIHIVFDEGDRKFVGEVIGVTNEVIDISLIGEIRDNNFFAGITRRPVFSNIARIITKPELELLIGQQDVSNKNTMMMGNSVVYDGFKVSSDLNDFFSNHFAILGNTGSGKSCGVARLIQNLYNVNDGMLPTNSHLVLFDVYGEYNSALCDLSKLPGINFKAYSTNISMVDTDLIKIPPYFLEVDDLALLLHCTSASQLPVIENALKLVYIFTSKDERIMQYKNDIIAKALLDILSSGATSTQIRDQVIAVLSKFNTESLNLDTIISQPGYNRTLKQCLLIDNQGKMNAVGLVVDMLQEFTKTTFDKIEIIGDLVYTLDDLYYAFEFALINEGIFNSTNVYELANPLKVRLQSILNSDYRKFFDFNEVISKEEYILRFFRAANGENAQLVNINFSFIEERFSKVLTKIFSKMFFNYTTSLKDRTSYPIHIILEEAHRYVQKDNDLDVIGYNIFDRITKEGRKYACVLGFITQRPSELSNTSLSQCSNFVCFKLFHPDDLDIVGSISSSVNTDMIKRLKNLRPGNALVFGNAFKIPLMVKMELPNPMPQSTNVDLVQQWYK